jgi:pimeloyl-ACP methyl ester carboxylesterase
MVPPAYAAPPTPVASTPATPSDAAVAASPTVVAEIPSLRTADSTSYRLSNGSVRDVISQADVRYRDTSGAWQPIDTSLVPDGPAGEVKTASTQVSTEIGSSSTTSPVRVSGDGYSVGIDYLGDAQDSTFVLGSTATYPDVAPGADLTYEARNDGVKETVYLASAGSPATYRFALALGGLSMHRDFATGQWGLFKTGETTSTLSMAPLVVADSSGGAAGDPAVCTSATTDVVTDGNTAYVTYTVPRSWLTDPARVFPVRVDPTLTLTSFSDTYVSTVDQASHGGSAELHVGYLDTTTGYNRALLRFDLSSLDSSDYILDASFIAHQFSETGANKSVYLGTLTNAFGPDSSWNTLGFTRNGQSAQISALGTQKPATSDTNVTWSVGPTVRNWVYGVAPNNGFAIYQKEDTSENSGYYRKFRSNDYGTASQRPQLVVDYSNPSYTPSGVDAQTYKVGDVVHATVHFGTCYNTDVNAIKVALRGVDGNSQPVTQGVLMWSQTSPSAGSWDTQAISGGVGGFVSAQTSSANPPKLQIIPGSCSSALSNLALDVNLAFTVGAGWGNVQDTDLVITAYMDPTDGNDSTSFWNSGEHVIETNFDVPDVTPPTTTSNAISSYNGTATISLAAADNSGGTGVAATYYKIDSGAQAVGTLISVAAPVSGVATHTISFWSVDSAGNVETAHAATFVVSSYDVTPPTTTSNAVSSYNGTATIALTATDNSGGSGVAATYYKIDSGAQQSGASIIVAAPASGVATHTISFWSVDKAGNVETAHTATFIVEDVRLPVLSNPSPANGSDVATTTPWVSIIATGTGPFTTHATINGDSVESVYDAATGRITLELSGPLDEATNAVAVSVTNAAGSTTATWTLAVPAPTLSDPIPSGEQTLSAQPDDVSILLSSVATITSASARVDGVDTPVDVTDDDVSLIPPDFPDGSHVVTVTVTNVLGQVSVAAVRLATAKAKVTTPPPIVVFVTGWSASQREYGHSYASSKPLPIKDSQGFRDLIDALHSQVAGLSIVKVPAAYREDVPDPHHVYKVNYDLVIDPEGDVFANGRRLANYLADNPIFQTGRPIILVGHSMGGLMIRAALDFGPRVSNSALQRTYAKAFQKLKANVKGVVTIGTPHEGSILANILYTAALEQYEGDKKAVSKAIAFDPAIYEMQVESSSGGGNWMYGFNLVSVNPNRIPYFRFAGLVYDDNNVIVSPDSDSGIIGPGDGVVTVNSAFGEPESGSGISGLDFLNGPKTDFDSSTQYLLDGMHTPDIRKYYAWAGVVGMSRVTLSWTQANHRLARV